MVKAQPTRKVVAALRAAGWVPARTDGSHTVWLTPDGSTVSVPDGHRTISPGVYRQILRELARQDEVQA